MKCEHMRAEWMEAIVGAPETVSPEMQEHLRNCDACAEEWASWQQTMALLDEWKTPEPSPYFSSRLQARLREEAGTESRSWLRMWFRRPLAATSAAALLAFGVGFYEASQWMHRNDTVATNDQPAIRQGVNGPGTAVSDLQYLDKNAELFSEFDALDNDSVQ